MRYVNDDDKVLGGVLPERRVTFQPPTNLEHLLVFRNELVPKYEQLLTGLSSSDAYKLLYLDLNEKAKDLLFDASDFNDFIIASANQPEHSEEWKIALGLFTGCLLHIWSEQHPEIAVHINGYDTRFDYLFYFAHQVGDLFLSNIDGDYILAFAGSHGGHVGRVELQNVRGYGVGFKVGFEGQAEKFVMNDTEGEK